MAQSAIKRDEAYTQALSVCSTNLKAFILAIANCDARIKWEILDRNGYKQGDGSYFRILSSLRTFKEQIAEYKKGRSGVKYNSATDLFSDYPKKGTHYLLTNRGVVDNASAVSTNAWCGESYHNWGLAVDFVLRSTGEAKTVRLDGAEISLAQFYETVGLTALAKEYGIEWGGQWASFPDVAHWEDGAYPLPPKEYHYAENGNFEFIEWYYGGKDGGTSQKGVALLVLGLLVGLGAFVFGWFKGR